MAPTLTASYYVESSKFGDSTTLATSSFTPADGEIIVVKATTWDTGATSGTPSGGSLTYTSRVTIAPAIFAGYARIFTAAVATSPGSMTVTLSAPSTSSYHSMCVERWSGAQLAGTPATSTGQYNGTTVSAPSATITTTGTGSIVSWVIADVNATSPTGRAYVSSATEDGLGDASSQGNGCFYHAYQSAAAAGSQTCGMSTPTQKWVMAMVEVQAASGGGGSTAIPGRLQPYVSRRRAANW